MPFFLSFFCIQVSRPYKQAELEIIFGEGVSKLVCDLLNFLCKFPSILYLVDWFGVQGCILDCAEVMDVVVRKGSWYSYGDHRFAMLFYKRTSC